MCSSQNVVVLTDVGALCVLLVALYLREGSGIEGKYITTDALCNQGGHTVVVLLLDVFSFYLGSCSTSLSLLASHVINKSWPICIDITVGFSSRCKLLIDTDSLLASDLFWCGIGSPLRGSASSHLA